MSESESEEARTPPHVQPGFVEGMSLLEPSYDKVHRGYIIAEGIKVRKINPPNHYMFLKLDGHVISEHLCVQNLVPLRLRYHRHFQEMVRYDDRYEEHIQ